VVQLSRRGKSIGEMYLVSYYVDDYGTSSLEKKVQSLEDALRIINKMKNNILSLGLEST
jgi:hypothetical protein